MLVKQAQLAHDLVQEILCTMPLIWIQELSSIHSLHLTPISSLKRTVLMAPSSAILIKNLLSLKPEVMLQALLIQTLNGQQLLLIQCLKLKNY